MKRLQHYMMIIALVLGLGVKGKAQNCNQPLSNPVFKKAMLGFSVMKDGTTRDRSIRAFISASCINSTQMRQLVALYADEAARADVACFAFSFVFDPNNYGVLSTLFTQPQYLQQFSNCAGIHLPGGGGNGMSTCGGQQMPAQQYKRYFSIIEDETFESDKMKRAKSLLKDKCLTIQQIYDITELFTFSSDRIRFARFAKDRTPDLQLYTELLPLFTFRSDRDKVMRMMND